MFTWLRGVWHEEPVTSYMRKYVSCLECVDVSQHTPNITWNTTNRILLKNKLRCALSCLGIVTFWVTFSAQMNRIDHVYNKPFPYKIDSTLKWRSLNASTYLIGLDYYLTAGAIYNIDIICHINNTIESLHGTHYIFIYKGKMCWIKICH